MKTNHTSANILFTLAFLVIVAMGSVSAQDATILALSEDGTEIKAPAHLLVDVHPLQAAVPKFLIGLKNVGEGYVTIRIKDSLGKNIHRPIFCYQKALAATFDMSQVEAGTYIVEVANKNELYRYHIQVGSKVVPSVEVRPNMLAKVK